MEVPQFRTGAKRWYGVWCPPFPAISKSEARAPVPYGVGATVSDILLMNHAGVTSLVFIPV